MKKFFLATIVFASFSIVSCTSEDFVQDSSIEAPFEDNTISIKDAALNVVYPKPESKTKASVSALGKVSWEAGDKLTVFIHTNDSYAYHKHSFVIDAKDLETNTFRHDPNCECKDQFAFKKGQAYDWYVSYDCSGIHPTRMSVDYLNRTIIKTKEQAPQSDLCLPMYAKAENQVCGEGNKLVESISMSNFDTFMKFTLTNKTGNDLSLNMIDFVAPEGTDVSVSAELNLVDQTHEVVYAKGEKHIFIAEFANKEILHDNESYTIYYTCHPFDLKEGDDFIITVRAYDMSKGSSQIINVHKKLTRNVMFEAGKSNSTSIDITYPEPGDPIVTE